MISSNLSLLTTKKGRLLASQAAQNANIDTLIDETSQELDSTLIRKSTYRKKKKIKKYTAKRKNNNCL